MHALSSSTCYGDRKCDTSDCQPSCEQSQPHACHCVEAHNHAVRSRYRARTFRSPSRKTGPPPSEVSRIAPCPFPGHHQPWCSNVPQEHTTFGPRAPAEDERMFRLWLRERVGKWSSAEGSSLLGPNGHERAARSGADRLALRRCHAWERGHITARHIARPFFDPIECLHDTHATELLSTQGHRLIWRRPPAPTSTEGPSFLTMAVARVITPPADRILVVASSGRARATIRRGCES